MPRDYQREFLARQERSRGRGYRSYAEERQERFRLQQRRTSRDKATPEHLRYLAKYLEPGYVQTAEFPLPEEIGPPSPEDLPHGLQGAFSPGVADDWDYYWPTRTINSDRPRTLQARYSQSARCLEIIFARPSRANPGGTWHYSNVPPALWTRFKRVESPGRYINGILNGFPYGPGGWDTGPTCDPNGADY
jgi:hypothetical protein